MTQTENTLIIPELKEEISIRIKRIKEILSQSEADAILVSDNADIYYTSGRFFRGYAYITADDEPVYFVIRPTGFGGDNVVAIRKPEQISGILDERALHHPKCLGLELDSLSYSDAMRLQKAFGDCTFTNASPILRKARMVKTPYEIREMEKDGLHQAAVYQRVARLYKPDMTDIEFQIEIEHTLRREGCLGFYRTSGNLMEINMGSVLSGDNADSPTPYDFALGGAGSDPALPVGADGSIMHPGQTVMIDMCGTFNGYQTDMSRVWSIGQTSEIAIKAHECSRRIMRELEKLAVPGTEVCALYHRAMAIAEEEGLQNYFMGHRQKAAFIGHGVGIQLNEQPAITAREKMPLEAGMTLAIEPKFVIPHVGPVGVENTYEVTPSGLRCLTIFPEEIQQL